MVTQTSSEVKTKLTMSFDKALKRTEEEEAQLPAWRPFRGGGGPPGGGDRAGGPLGGGDGAGGPLGGPDGGDPAPAGPNLPANL